MPRRNRTGRSDKRTFILSQPMDMPAKEVVEKAWNEGIRLKEPYVYVVRSNARRDKNGAANARTNRPGAAIPASRSTESAFRRLAIELGLDKSKQLLTETERKIADLIAGR